MSPATLAAVLATASVGLGAIVAIITGFRHSTLREFPPRAETLLVRFAAGSVGADVYEDLFRYFLTGFLSYRQPQGALASYPGLPSTHGERVDAMEGFTRFAPMAAAWLHSGRSSEVVLADGRTLDLVEILRRGLIVGTDSASAEYWGEVRNYDQRMVEAADVALTLWLTRAVIWDRLDRQEREQIAGWLSSAITRAVPDNNWHLFPTLVSLVLHDLGVSVDITTARQHYARLKTFYRGEGWFSDGPGEVYDYYNAWEIHYHLYWMSRVSPDWDAAFIASSRQAFLQSYKYLIGRNGIPIRGRSVCYRLAAAAPLVFDYASGSPSIKAGEARRALDLTWSYFVGRGAVRGGTVTQGYCGPDERLLDNYSGPASCLWSLRSLIPAFAIPARDAFWAGPADSLPIDRGDYRLRVESLGWTIMGDAQSGSTTLIADDSLPDSLTYLRSAGAWTELKSLITGRPNRARNRMAKYQRGTYYSDPPFCGCS